MNMEVRQEVIDFLINLLLQMGEMDKEQWEMNQTIYLNKFVRQFKKLWYDRYKSVPDAKGNFINYRQEKDANKVSRTGKGNNRVKYNSNNKVEDNDTALSISYYEKLYPKKDLSFIGKYLKENPNPKHSKAINLCEQELRTKPIIFNKTTSGKYYRAWCSKCGKEDLPNDEWQLKKGSECCRAEYINKKKED